MKRVKKASVRYIKEYVEDGDEIFQDGEYNNLIVEEIDNLIGYSSIAIIQPWIKWGRKKKRYTSPELLLDEACALVQSLPLMTIAMKESVSIQDLSKVTTFGTGTEARLKFIIQSSSAQAVFISVDNLSCVERSEFEELFGMPVFDRFMMVLFIFKFYAQTMEAKLQIALAELPRIRNKYDKESEKLIIHRHEDKLKTAIGKLAAQRAVIREQRKKLSLTSVAVIGYTNCGKTSMIRRLTGDELIKGENRLFATLDVTAHKGFIPCGLNVLYLDTVGFIQDIPLTLIASFRATLQDALNADVIIHIRDISHPDIVAQTKSVNDTLKDIDVPESTPILIVNNKSDLMEQSFEEYSHLDREHDVYKEGLYVSAITGHGIKDMLVELQGEMLKATKRRTYSMKLPIGSPNISWLKNNMNIASEEVMEDLQHTKLLVFMNDSEKALYRKAFGL